MHFICKSCNIERNLRTELSTFSKEQIKKGSTSDETFLVCKYCAPPGKIPSIIPERQTHVDIRDVPPSSVVEDRMLSYVEAAELLGYSHGGFRYLIDTGRVRNERFGKKLHEVGVRESEVMRFMETSYYRDREQSVAEALTHPSQPDKPNRSRHTSHIERSDPDPVKPHKKHAQAVFVKRVNEGLSQDALAKQLGISQSHFSRYERALSLPRHAYDVITKRFLGDATARPIEPPKGAKKFAVNEPHPQKAKSPVRRKKAEPKPESPTPRDLEVNVGHNGEVRYRTIKQPVEVPVETIRLVPPGDALEPATLLERAQTMLQAGDVELAQKLMDLAMTLIARNNAQQQRA